MDEAFHAAYLDMGTLRTEMDREIDANLRTIQSIACALVKLP
jgi:hypothetical protein